MKEKQKENTQTEKDKEKAPPLDNELDWTDEQLDKLRREDKGDIEKEKP